MAQPALPEFYQVMRLGEIGSTNAEAKRLAAKGAVEGLLIVADRQTAGRGRLRRPWISPPGNLYASLVLRPDRPMRDVLQVGFVAAVAAAGAISAALPAAADVRLKWPNDVLVNGRKVAGMLLEGDAAADGGALWLVLGIGVNIRSHPPEDATSYPATSLSAEGATDLTVDALLAGFAAAFLDRYRDWLADGFAGVRRDWLGKAIGRGDPVDVRLDAATTLRGRFLDLDDDGALLLATGDGHRHRITAGDIFPLHVPS